MLLMVSWSWCGRWYYAFMCILMMLAAFFSFLTALVSSGFIPINGYLYAREEVERREIEVYCVNSLRRMFSSF